MEWQTTTTVAGYIGVKGSFILERVLVLCIDRFRQPKNNKINTTKIFMLVMQQYNII